METFILTMITIQLKKPNKEHMAANMSHGQSSDYMYFSHSTIFDILSTIADLIDHLRQYLLTVSCLLLNLLKVFIQLILYDYIL